MKIRLFYQKIRQIYMQYVYVYVYLVQSGFIYKLWWANMRSQLKPPVTHRYQEKLTKVYFPHLGSVPFLYKSKRILTKFTFPKKTYSPLLLLNVQNEVTSQRIKDIKYTYVPYIINHILDTQYFFSSDFYFKKPWQNLF